MPEHPQVSLRRPITVIRKALRLLAILLTIAPLAFAQANQGALRLTITGATGSGIPAQVHLSSESNQYSRTLSANSDGLLEVTRLPYGVYRIQIQHSGFLPIDQSIEIRSALPTPVHLQLKIAPLVESVTVHTPDTLLATDQPGTVEMLGATEIRDRLGSIPGRSLQDLVNSQPGWLYEGNAVLHPRGAEYQTQFVIDGIPLTDNRSPGFGPEIPGDEIQSLSIYTAGIPAEYGRKLGGVIEVETIQDAQAGLHGTIAFNGGSFSSAGGSGQIQYVRGKNTTGIDAGAAHTDRYLNPVVPQNYRNTGNLANLAARYERAFSNDSRLTLSLRQAGSAYDIPNEQLQQAAGQHQTAGNRESMAVAAYQRILSDHATATAHAMFRQKSNSFDSNPQSTPIGITQRNRLREAYFNASATFDRGAHEWKAGLDSQNTFLREQLSYFITDPSRFDPGTAPNLAFSAQRPDLEQSAYVQDLVRLRTWTIAAGLRWDHYQLLLTRQSVQPRLAISHTLPKSSLVFHLAYDRIFQTPSSDNILLSSSNAIESVSPSNFLRLPVRPSVGDYYEAGLSRAFQRHLRLDANYFRRFFRDFADDDQLQNTAISFPISFRKAIIYGAEAKLALVNWNRFSGFASYSYQVGNAWFPVTGGLFLGDNASSAASQLTGHFPNTQDQRNTFRGRLRCNIAPRLFVAAGAIYDSGVPFEFDGSPETVLAQYGPAVLTRLDFNRGRIKPVFQANASAGAVLHRSDHRTTSFQIDGENLNNVLDVLDFGGLFSGNAIGPPRSVSMRLTTTF